MEDDYDIEIDGYDNKLQRRITIARRSFGVLFSGLLFLIWRS
jgi:hypothetical protein